MENQEIIKVSTSIERVGKQIAIINKLIHVKVTGKEWVKYCNSSRQKFRNQDYNGAITDLDVAITLQPNFASAYFGRGNAKFSNKDFQGAINDYIKGIVVNTTIEFIIDGNNINDGDINYRIYNSIGIAYIKLGDPHAAILAFTNAIELMDNYAEAYYDRGRAKIQLGQKDSACIDFHKARDLGFSQANEYIERCC